MEPFNLVGWLEVRAGRAEPAEDLDRQRGEHVGNARSFVSRVQHDQHLGVTRPRRAGGDQSLDDADRVRAASTPDLKRQDQTGSRFGHGTIFR
ncbi:hypothetical protein [Streptomyces sp. NPDC018036]|uniref:hypothetical protein n=1 Tax=Streptomyces sp. NPDC018036 TaxID=3365035 RepID=UPI00379262FC